MKQNMIRNHAVQEGILFLLLGGALLAHGLDSHHKAFNQDWTQSPYLFPVLVAVLVGVLSVSLLYQGMKAAVRSIPVGTASAAGEPEERGQAGYAAGEAAEAGQTASATFAPGRHGMRVLVVLAMSLAYYLALAVLKIPYITFGILSWSFTVSNFEVVTLIFLVAMMLYLGVRRIPVLVAVPVCTTLFLSVAFRAMLHVLLP